MKLRKGSVWNAFLILLVTVAFFAVVGLFAWEDQKKEELEGAKQETLTQIKDRVKTEVHQDIVEEDRRLLQNQVREQERERLEAKVREMKISGAIYSVNIEMNEVRIAPIVWLGLNVTEKQGVVMFFSQYFDLCGSTGRVTVLSSRNDTKLAKYSVWSGVTIYQ